LRSGNNRFRHGANRPHSEEDYWRSGNDDVPSRNDPLRVADYGLDAANDHVRRQEDDGRYIQNHLWYADDRLFAGLGYWYCANDGLELIDDCR